MDANSNIIFQFDRRIEVKHKQMIIETVLSGDVMRPATIYVLLS